MTFISTSRDRYAFLLVLIASVAVSAVYYTGLFCSDDTRYLIGAIRIAIGEEISVSSLAERRAVFLLPASLVYGLIQHIELSIAIYVLFYVGLVVVLYMVAREFFEVWAACCIALLGLVQPTIFLYSGALLPDIPASFFLALTLLFTLKLVFLCPEHKVGRVVIFRSMACGISAAVAFTLKESSLVIVPVVALIIGVGLLRTRSPAWWGATAAILAGFAGVMLVEMLLFKVVAGEWYSSFKSLLSPHDFRGFASIQGTTVAARLSSLYGQLGHYTAMLFLLAAISSCRILYEWNRGLFRNANLKAWFVVVAFWAWPTFYFTFGSSSLSEYAFPVMQQRYYAPCVAPAALLAGRLLTPLMRISTPIVLRTFSILVFAAFLTAPFIKISERGLIYGAPAKDAFLTALHDVESNYPHLRIIDTDSGWTTDLNRCRILLSSNNEAGHQHLIDTIKSGRDLDARFKYSDVNRLEPPFALIGHGDVLDRSKGWAEHLGQRAASGEVRVDLLGQYQSIDCPAIQEYWFMPRSLAARKCLKNSEISNSHAVNDGRGKGALRDSVRVYLVSEGDFEIVDP